MKAKYAHRIRLTILGCRAEQRKYGTTKELLDILEESQRHLPELEQRVIDREADRFVYGKNFPQRFTR